MKKLFTSESVTSGHPDKICDLIADSILDAALAQDKYSHMAVEATIKNELIFVYGEAGTKADLDYEKIALDVLKQIGYTEDYKVITKIDRQSPEINHAVSQKEIMAGDQGIIFGFACDETEEAMPLSMDLAHKLARMLEEVRRANPGILQPDGKTQVTVEYEDDRIVRLDTILVSTSHFAGITNDFLRDFVKKEVILPVCPKDLIDENTRFIINPSGAFTVCGSFGDSGTTGRKIVVDTYGGHGHIGGGCFSSKDPSKVDRTAAYYARYVTKNLVRNGLCRKCEIQLAYAIGMRDPVSVYLDCFGTNTLPMDRIMEIIHENFDFSVSNMIEELDLLRPIYTQTTNYGHFGKKDLPWEKVIDLKVL